MLIERYSFVAITTMDLEQARRFWVDQLQLAVIREKAGSFFMLDAGTLRLCIDLADGDIHRSGGTDPVIGFKVASLAETLAELAARDIHARLVTEDGRSFAELRDPDGHVVIFSEAD
jgi:catechol 2,3-dioxygenase-like lactoylglutathione lyase family enzyme